MKSNGPDHGTIDLIAYAHRNTLNKYEQLLLGDKAPILSAPLHVLPYIAYGSSGGSGETVRVV